MNHVGWIAGVIAGATVFLAACGPIGASSGDELKAQQATLQALAEVTDPEAVTISDLELSPTRVTWTAKADGRTYVCDADDQFRVPSCAAETA